MNISDFVFVSLLRYETLMRMGIPIQNHDNFDRPNGYIWALHPSSDTL